MEGKIQRDPSIGAFGNTVYNNPDKKHLAETRGYDIQRILKNAFWADYGNDFLL